RRGAGRFAGAFLLAAGSSLAVTALILWQQGTLTSSLQSALSLSDWQPFKQPTTTTESFWFWWDGTGVYGVYRIPVFIAYLALVVTTLFWPAPKNLAHVLALSGAVLIGIQFWYTDRGGVYVLWYLPILLLLVFRPNLSERRPLPIQPDTDWLTRSRRAVGRWLGWLAVRVLGSPQPAARVH